MSSSISFILPQRPWLVPISRRRYPVLVGILASACLLIGRPLPAQDLSNLAVAKTYTEQRITSSDLTGGNDDGDRAHPIMPGETRTLGQVAGPGIITHMWFTIDSPEYYHLKRIVLRIYWDDDPIPAVETPIGDFFGLGLGEYFLYESGPVSVGSQKALNEFFPMPFRKSARLTITNEGSMPTRAFYFNIDWQKHTSLPKDLLYFFAEYRQAQPTPGTTSDWKLNSDVSVYNAINKDAKNNYVAFETESAGHYVGMTLSILQNQGDWWGEGDDMMFVDDRTTPAIVGTGAEDYFLGAWCYGNCAINPFGSAHPTFAYQRYGNPVNGGDDRGAHWMVYRFHTDSPVPFTKYFKMTLEHGHANHRSDNYYSVAYWYQKGTHNTLRQPLPSVDDRIPRMINTEGPTMGKH